MAHQYVPQIPQVLFFTKLVEPGETVTVQFKAPAQPGQSPYVCTFPGHWRIMNGILTVQAPQGRGRGGLRPERIFRQTAQATGTVEAL